MAAPTVKVEVEEPDDVFDREYAEAAFGAGGRELAILELVRLRAAARAQGFAASRNRALGIAWQNEAGGIAPTEQIFSSIKSELQGAVEAATRRRMSR